MISQLLGRLVRKKKKTWTLAECVVDIRDNPGTTKYSNDLLQALQLEYGVFYSGADGGWFLTPKGEYLIEQLNMAEVRRLLGRE